MDNFVALLGTKGGPAIRPGSPMPTSSLLAMEGQHLVVDCGLGVARGLTDQGMALRDLSVIFITHLHSDHYLELGPLLHTAWTAGLKTPVRIFGPEGIAAYWQAFLLSMKADIDLRIEDEGRPDLASLVTISPINEGAFLTLGDITVSALRNEHPPITDSFALAFHGPRHQVVFSGDTAFLPALAEFAHGADLLIHEAMLKDGLGRIARRAGNGDDRLLQHILRSHSMAEQAAEIARLTEAKALAFHHLIPADDPDFTDADWQQAVRGIYEGPLYLGRDGLRIPLD